ncbi:MAG: hypothetical protein PHO37_14550 [Kiritimatiellae bacterium]|nr:hypothetical protein [Kiritimatiellia bacterium]
MLWLVGMLTLVLVWVTNSPEWIKLTFDMQGRSPVELATITLFFFQMAFFWVLPPVSLKPLRGKLLMANFSMITFIAICREMDWHKAMINVSDVVGATTGTPFKMRFLTNSANPLADRLLVLFCFVAVIGICAGTLLWYIRPLLKGLFKFHPVCWSVAFLGGSVILINIFDRAGSGLKKYFDFVMSPQLQSLFTVFEEGQELLLPLIVIVAVIQSHFIYNRESDEENVMAQHKNQL